MTDAPPEPSNGGQPTVEQAVVAAPSPAAPDAERPELAVGAAFAGGLALALLLKRLVR